MKMGNRKHKFLDRMGNRTMSKTRPVAKPTNRAERRVAAKLERQAKKQADAKR